jgi:hypothetical protein
VSDLRYTPQLFTDYGLTKGELVEIVATAEENAYLGYDKATGEYDATKIAESVAFDLGHDEWLDVETHPLWDIAAETAMHREED